MKVIWPDPCNMPIGGIKLKGLYLTHKNNSYDKTKFISNVVLILNLSIKYLVNN